MPVVNKMRNGKKASVAAPNLVLPCQRLLEGCGVTWLDFSPGPGRGAEHQANEANERGQATWSNGHKFFAGMTRVVSIKGAGLS